ncbi:hypothetical protein [Selenomonas sp. AE3005]|uniref:hypothetical protein n=1 Tax=Selenomonas sp. AE3005 TaxID=1485543 RepID=UPI0025FB211F|nr:hypothetical protein [Selenomonas sp. AE3005]
MGINIHGDFYTGMAQLRLNVFEVKVAGILSAANKKWQILVAIFFHTAVQCMLNMQRAVGNLPRPIPAYINVFPL